MFSVILQYTFIRMKIWYVPHKNMGELLGLLMYSYVYLMGHMWPSGRSLLMTVVGFPKWSVVKFYLKV